MIYVALLRGINVGGKNRVEMKLLKTICEETGLSKVQTYINSGNIIFEDNVHTSAQLTQLLEKIIEKSFGFFVKVLIRDLPAIKKIITALPTRWVNDKVMKCDTMFLWESVDSREVLSGLRIKENIDEVKYVSGAILWRVDREHISKSGLLKIVGTKLYQQMTVRNSNTTRKIYELMNAKVK